MSESSSNTVFLFPGQGAQYKGIGSDLYNAFTSVKAVYEEASDILGIDMQSLSFDDPENKINLTRYTQPVLVTHHTACLRAYQEIAETPITPNATAGHSLGEYSALVAAGSLTFSQALSLVAKRGELMGTYGQGEMMALTIDAKSAQPLADKHYCALAGLNLADQTVVGGSSSDLKALAEEFAEIFPKKRAIPLKTEGAFHTYYNIEAAQKFREVLAKTDFSLPNIHVVANYTGDFHANHVDSIRSNLFFQLFHPVNWIGCLDTLIEHGTTSFIEFGGGIGNGESPAEKRANLEGMVKKFTRRIKPKPDYACAINLESIRALAAN